MSGSSLMSTRYHCWVPKAVAGGRSQAPGASVLSRPSFVCRNFTGAVVEGVSPFWLLFFSAPLLLCREKASGEGFWLHTVRVQLRAGGHETAPLRVCQLTCSGFTWQRLFFLTSLHSFYLNVKNMWQALGDSTREQWASSLWGPGWFTSSCLGSWLYFKYVPRTSAISSLEITLRRCCPVPKSQGSADLMSLVRCFLLLLELGLSSFHPCWQSVCMWVCESVWMCNKFGLQINSTKSPLWDFKVKN